MTDSLKQVSGESSSLRAWLELFRLSNAPTVISNVLTGCAIGALVLPVGEDLVWHRVALLSLAMLLLYVGGMALNDVVDTNIDRAMRPTRPIPSGRVNRGSALACANLLLALGLSIVAAISLPAILPALTLVACIVVYDLTHKLTSASVILMGACRGFVYVTCAIAVSQPPAAVVLSWMAGSLTVYIILLSLIARRETQSSAGALRYVAFVLPMVALTPGIVLGREWSGWTIAVAIVLVALHARTAGLLFVQKMKLSNAVATWLATVCLIDAYYASLLDQPQLAAVSFGCFLMTSAAHRFIPGT